MQPELEHSKGLLTILNVLLILIAKQVSNHVLNKGLHTCFL